jgi:hypothetical protein
MIEINLLPTQLRARSHPTQKKAPALAPVPKAFPLGLVGLTLLMGLLVFVSGTQVGARERESRQVQHELAQAKEQAAEAEQITTRFDEVAARYEVLASRLDGRIEWTEVLRVVSLRCPDGVSITSLVVDRHKRTGRPLKLIINGTYDGTASLEMRFANGLKESATLSEFFDAVIPEKELLPEGQTKFGISCLFRPFTDELIEGTEESRPR